MAADFDYRTSAQQAEEAAWALADQAVAATSRPAAATSVSGILEAVGQIADARTRDGVVAGIADYLAPNLPDAGLIRLLDTVTADATAAASARQVAVQRLDAGDAAAGSAFADYAAGRIAAIADPGEAAAAWTELARALVEAGRPAGETLARAEAEVDSLPPGPDAADQRLGIAAAWQGLGEDDAAVRAVDRAMAGILDQPADPRRDELVVRGLDLYLGAGAEDRAMALLDRLDPDAAGLNARTAAQTLLRNGRDLSLADRFIGRIQQPYERFLALESRLARAGRDHDQAEEARSARAVYDLLPRLAPGAERTEALLLLARFHATSGRDTDALKTLDLADKETARADGALQPGFEHRIQELRAVLGGG